MKQKVIKPYHLFNHEGHTYVINVEGMLAGTIDETVAKALKRIEAETNAPLDPHIEKELKKLGLLLQGGGQASRAKEKLKKTPHPIVKLSLFLTQSCNLRCVYCYGDGGEYGSGGNMNEETAFQTVDWVIEQSGKMKHIHIDFFGGEPFLKFPLMKAIVKYAKKKAAEANKKVSFHATSNATLFNDEIISFIKEDAISVMVSFDGPKEIQDAQRPYANGKGSYDSAVPKIKKLLAAVPETAGHAVLVGDTEPQIVKDALKGIGFTDISIMPASQSLFTDKPVATNSARDTQRLLQERTQEANTWVQRIQNRDINALKQLKSKSELYYAVILLLHNSKRKHACGAGLGLVAVSTSGDVFLCHRFVGQEDYRLGSVFDRRLNRQEYQKSPTTSNAQCSSCFARYYCAGGCKHDNAAACGSTAVPAEDMCRLRCREFELAAYIVSNLSTKDREFLIDQEIFPPKPCPLDF